MNIDQIKVVEGDCAAVSQVSYCGIFGYGTCYIATAHRDRRYVVAAGDDDRYQLVNAAALSITDRDGECFSGGLTQCQILSGAVGYRVVPGNCSRRGGSRFAYRCHYQSATQCAAGLDHTRGVNVSQVKVTESDRTAVGQIRRGCLFGYCACHIAAANRDSRRIVSTGDSNRLSLINPGVIHINNMVVHDDHAVFTNRQIIKHTIYRVDREHSATA